MESMTEEKCLIKIIKYILNQTTDSDEITVTDWKRIIVLAKRNGTFQYVYRYMRQLHEEKRLSSEIVLYMDRLNALELRKGILQEDALEKIEKRLEEKGIDHMFVKGSVTKNRYPDPFLRSMGDIDLLYNKEQHGQLCEAMKELGFMLKSVGRVHDIYVDSNNILVEAHRQLVSSNSPFYTFCKSIWSRAENKEGFQHAYSMRLEDELIFNFLHLVSHFKKGGVGIRFIVDVWIYKQFNLDWEYIKDQIKGLRLMQFYNAIGMLSEKWFGEVETDDSLIREIEEYILSGGTFGNSQNQKSAAIRNGRVKYFFKVCFPSFEEMQSMFPTLKNRAMLPIAWMRRIIESLMKRRYNVKALLAPIKYRDTDSIRTMKQFFIRCGLE